MRLLCLALLCLQCAVGEDTLASDVALLQGQLSGILQNLQSKQRQIDALTAHIDDLERAEIRLYRDRSDCPEGFSPMENAYGRIIVLDGPSRGTVSKHTFKDERVLTMPCASTIQVSESGATRVCGGSEDGTGSPVAVDLENLIPHVVMMGCFRNKGPQPVLP
jgi:hypothetical protein